MLKGTKEGLEKRYLVDQACRRIRGCKDGIEDGCQIQSINW